MGMPTRLGAGVSIRLVAGVSIRLVAGVSIQSVAGKVGCMGAMWAACHLVQRYARLGRHAKAPTFFGIAHSKPLRRTYLCLKYVSTGRCVWMPGDA